MPIKTSSAKAKGRRLQQLVRDKILEIFPKLTSDDVRSTSMGATGEDILLSSAARKLFPYSVECKSRKNIAVYSDYDQAQNNCPDGAEPLVIMKANRRKPLALVDADYFFKLLRKDKSK
tara:strand:- start:48 stop:404 length:357 start_codon:yes stop_codon:yes gene_type:complete